MLSDLLCSLLKAAGRCCNLFELSWMAKKNNLSIEKRASVVTLSKENYSGGL